MGGIGKSPPKEKNMGRQFNIPNIWKKTVTGQFLPHYANRLSFQIERGDVPRVLIRQAACREYSISLPVPVPTMNVSNCFCAVSGRAPIGADVLS